MLLLNFNIDQTMKRTILLSVFCLIIGMLSAQTAKTVWDYPVKPGMEQWKELKSYEDQLQAYNIPDEIITKISTVELVKICLAYPEWGVVNAFNDRRTGLSNMISNFNGFRELFMRNDAAKELIKVYSNLDPLAIGNDWTLQQKGNYCFQINYIELLLSHGMMIEKLNAQDVQVLLNEVVLKYNRKKQLPDVYSLWSLSPTACLCLSMFDRNGELSKSDAKLLSLKRTFMSDSIEVLNKVFEQVNHLKKQ
jgi:hypothetical protein